MMVLVKVRRLMGFMAIVSVAGDWKQHNGSDQVQTIGGFEVWGMIGMISR
jgi:hypothetical protein